MPFAEAVAQQHRISVPEGQVSQIRAAGMSSFVSIGVEYPWYKRLTTLWEDGSTERAETCQCVEVSSP